MPTDPVQVLTRLAARADRAGRLVHLEQLPDRAARHVDWPAWAHPDLVAALVASGVVRPWSHQVVAAEHARAGRHVVLATGTASGKSLAYLLPSLTGLAETGEPARRRDLRPSVLYLSPTKALARDQLGRVADLVSLAGLSGVRAAAVDGDNSMEERAWAREHASFVLANPDICHRTLLPGHERWARFWRGLTYVVVDECHHYRGVFGSHVAQVLRRLRRIAAHHGAYPTFVLASATVSEPERTASRLTGLPVVPVVDDGSPRRGAQVALWEPPLTDGGGENGAPTRRPASVETADLLTDLVVAGVRTVAFVRSRRAAETIALGAQRRLAEVEPGLARRVDAYRGGYLPEERRAIEQALGCGELLGLASTNALELGIDVAGLDVVLTTGYPGTRAALWQQFGRAGRSGQSSLGVLIARDDPLDSYLIAHPEALLGAPVEATVIDPDNPYVLGPHLAAAAAELPLREQDLALFGPLAPVGVEAMVGAGLLRRRPNGWFWTRRERAGDLADIRSSGGRPVQIVVEGSGRLLGTVDASAAHATVHTAAVYLHHGDTYVVQDFDPEGSAALVRRADPDWTTTARTVTEIRVVDAEVTESWGRADLCFGTVSVTDQVVGYLRRRLGSGEVLGEEPLDLPARVLHTKAVWWTLDGSQLSDSGVATADLPGAAHAAEHAAIGLLPLFATCDRWDIGGVSTALHPDTGRLSVFVHDGHPGGAGFAERGFRTAAAWLRATAQAIAACACEAGCPSCVQSPKCGNQNHPLDKPGALALLDVLLAGAPRKDAADAG
ncbi:MAG: DEAD/DEAH box helicase [Actinomycetota bacterium]|nr:DEAD/DEAH box helicase [Actinomycetota bacterium]